VSDVCSCKNEQSIKQAVNHYLVHSLKQTANPNKQITNHLIQPVSHLTSSSVPPMLKNKINKIFFFVYKYIIHYLKKKKKIVFGPLVKNK